MPTTDDAAAAAGRAEVEGVETVTVTFRDLTPFEIPRYRLDWPFDAVVAAEQELFPLMLSLLLPPAALEEFRATRPTGRDANALLAAVGEAMGFTSPGESPASTE